MKPLLPCPFCGGEAAFSDWGSRVTIGCKPCNYQRVFLGALANVQAEATANGGQRYVNLARDCDPQAIERAVDAWNGRVGVAA